MNILTYTVIRVLLSFASLLNLNMMLTNRGMKDFINRQVKMAELHTIIILFTFLLTYISGMLILIFQSEWGIKSMRFSSVILGIGLLFIEIILLKNIIEFGYRPGFSITFSNSLVYIAVLGLIFDRIEIPWSVVAVVSTILAGCIIYFSLMLWKYRKIVNMLVELLDLYSPAVGTRLFSFTVGIILISYGHSEGVFKGLIASSSGILAGVLWYTGTQMEKLVKLSKNSLLRDN